MHFETDGSQQLPYYFIIWRFSGEVSTLGCQGNVSRGHCCHGIAFQPIPAEETVCERGGVSLTHTHTHAHAFLHIHAYIRTQRHAHTYTHIHTSLIAPASIAANFTYHLNYIQRRQVPLVLLTAPPPLHPPCMVQFSFFCFLLLVCFVLFCFVSCCSSFLHVLLCIEVNGKFAKKKRYHM